VEVAQHLREAGIRREVAAVASDQSYPQAVDNILAMSREQASEA
jgi:hypothetical protein